jgi:hypothetical protein
MVENKNWVSVAVIAGLALGASMGASQAHATCTFGSSSEPALQTSFDTLLGSGVLNAANDCLAEGSEAQWETPNLAGATILLELAGNAGTNTFGVYNVDNPSEYRSVFAGSASAGSNAYLFLTYSAGNWGLNILGSSPGFLNLGANPVFGFYLGTVHGMFRSSSSLNSDGTDHMYAYQGTDTLFQSGPSNGTMFSSSSYILAWEDLPATSPGYDRDYQDFLVQVVNVTPVPLPTALWLMASGLICLAGVARRKA